MNIKEIYRDRLNQSTSDIADALITLYNFKLPMTLTVRSATGVSWNVDVTVDENASRKEGYVAVSFKESIEIESSGDESPQDALERAGLSGDENIRLTPARE